MRYAGIFVAVIIILIFQVFPDWAVVLTASTLLVITKVAAVSAVFAPFSGSTMWLIIMVFALAAGVGKSGILPRIGLTILSLFPASYNGAVVALMTSGIVVTPLIPSVNAKVNIMIPIATAVTEQVGLPERSKGALGLFSASYMTIMLCGNAFISGSAYVAIMLGFLPGSNFNLLSWFVATSIWFAVLLVGIFVYCTTYCKPAQKLAFPPDYFKDKLKELGPMSRDEKFAGVLLAVCLVVWMTAKLHGFDTGMVGLLAVCVMVGYGLMTGADFIGKIPWTLIVFIGCLLGMAGLMATLGWSDLIAALLGPVFAPIVDNPWVFVPFLCVFTYLLRFVVVEQLTSLLVTLAIFSPLMEQAGMNLFVLVFVQFMAAMVWNVPYQNPYPLATLQIAGGKYVTFAELRKSSFAYMVICLIGVTASIPLWQALGFIR
jgi:DASS family divalent anion:Na+ symporter